MAQDADGRPLLSGREATIAAAGLVAIIALLQVSALSDLLSDLTRPLIVRLLGAFGVVAAERSGHLLVGAIDVPWTRDCAGLNILGLLWALAFWTAGRTGCWRTLLVRLLVAVPLGIAANVGRVLTLVAYRTAFAPAVESPQLHYFIGFLWVLPCLFAFLPARSKHLAWGEALHVSAIFALAAPFVAAAGGTTVACATVAVLALTRRSGSVVQPHVLHATAWLCAGIPIAATRMESLWIPWLLCAPWLGPVRQWWSIPVVVLLASTVPLVAMQSFAPLMVAAAVAYEGIRLLRIPRASAQPVAPTPPANGDGWHMAWAAPAIAAAVLFPFLAASAAAQVRPGQGPPDGLMQRPFDSTTFRVRVPGQPRDLYVDWYEPYGEGRHHTLPVCMQYRGVTLRASGEPAVMTDGTWWMREFFLVEGDLLADYPAYLRRTLGVFTPAGVHLIASARQDAMDARTFADIAARAAADLQRMQQPRTASPR